MPHAKGFGGHSGRDGDAGQLFLFKRPKNRFVTHWNQAELLIIAVALAFRGVFFIVVLYLAIGSALAWTLPWRGI